MPPPSLALTQAARNIQTAARDLQSAPNSGTAVRKLMESLQKIEAGACLPAGAVNRAEEIFAALVQAESKPAHKKPTRDQTGFEAAKALVSAVKDYQQLQPSTCSVDSAQPSKPSRNEEGATAQLERISQGYGKRPLDPSNPIDSAMYFSSVK